MTDSKIIKHTDGFTVFTQGEWFRVCTVSRLCFGSDEPSTCTVSPKESIAVEKRLGSEIYIVIAFVNWDNKHKKAVYKDCDFRTADIFIQSKLSPSDFYRYAQEFANSVEFAQKTITDLNTEEE